MVTVNIVFKDNSISTFTATDKRVQKLNNSQMKLAALGAALDSGLDIHNIKTVVLVSR